MSRQFTPGPWSVSSGGGHIQAWREGIPRKVCLFKGNMNAEADARLIAAAPDLLDGAEVAHAALTSINPVDRTLEEQQAIEWLEKAIAKARGQ